MGRRWLLDWTVGGRVYRFATDRVSVTDADATTWPYEPGLSVAALSRVADSTTFELGQSVAAIDWAALVSRGMQLERTTAVLRLHTDGQTLEQAQVWLRGLAIGVEYGDKHEPLTATLDGARATQSRMVPPPSTIYGPTTWPARGPTYPLPEESEGGYPPLVFGYPGRDDVQDLSFPAYRVYPTEVRTAGGTYDDRCPVAYGRIAASEVTIKYVAGGESPTSDFETSIETSEGVDLLGQVVTYVEPSGSDGWNGDNGFDESAEIWAFHTASLGGGVQSGGSVVRGAADVVLYMLDHWTDIQVDRGRWARWAPVLNVIKIDTVLEVPTNAWEWVERAVLPLLEVEVRQSSRGLWLMPLRWDATARDAVGTLEVGRNCERAGRVRVRDPVRNRFEIKYGRSTASRWRSTSVLAGEPGLLSDQSWFGSTTTDPRVLTSYVCARSMAEWGEVVDTAISTAVLWDPASALRVLQLRALRFAWPHRTLQLTGGAELARYDAGDVVHVIDDGLSISSTLAIVEDVIDSLGTVRLNVTLLDGPAR